MAIYDGRPLAGELSLDIHGFRLVPHQTAVTNFYGERQVPELYYPEIKRLVKEATGAARTLIFDHIVRSVPEHKRGEAGVRTPATARAQRLHAEVRAPAGPGPFAARGGRGATQAPIRHHDTAACLDVEPNRRDVARRGVYRGCRALHT